MTITVGTDSYVSLAEADTYFSSRANAAWALLASDKREAALLIATDYLESVYAWQWAGVRTSSAQVLSWPRVGVEIDGVVLPSDTVPARLKNAQIELAWRASQGSLLADEGPAVKSEAVGPLKVEYQDNTRSGVRYLAVDALIAPLLASGGFNRIKVVRA